jgi:hypothetical protein
MAVLDDGHALFCNGVETSALIFPSGKSDFAMRNVACNANSFTVAPYSMFRQFMEEVYDAPDSLVRSFLHASSWSWLGIVC